MNLINLRTFTWILAAYIAVIASLLSVSIKTLSALLSL